MTGFILCIIETSSTPSGTTEFVQFPSTKVFGNLQTSSTKVLGNLHKSNQTMSVSTVDNNCTVIDDLINAQNNMKISIDALTNALNKVNNSDMKFKNNLKSNEVKQNVHSEQQPQPDDTKNNNMNFSNKNNIINWKYYLYN